MKLLINFVMPMSGAGMPTAGHIYIVKHSAKFT